MFNMGLPELILMPITMIVPAAIVYFIIKLAVKNAIKELKSEGHL